MAVIGLALGAFILQEAIQNLRLIFSDEESRTTMAVVYDQRIDQQAYQAEVERQLALFELYNQQPQDPTQVRQQIQEQVWNRMVQNALEARQLGGIGLRIGNQELADMFVGPNPDPIVVQNLGNDPAQIQQLVQQGQSGQNPQLGAFLTVLEEYLLQNRLQERQNALLRNAIHVSNAKARRALTHDRRSATGEVLAVNYGTISDSIALAAITESDYVNYYNENRERFRQTQPQATVSFLPLMLVPTAKDTALALQTLVGYAEALKSSANDSAYAAGRTRLRTANAQPLFDYQFRPIGSFSPRDSSIIAGMAQDSVYGPYVEANSFRILKLSGRSTADADQTVYISHILVPAQDSARAVALLDSVRAPGANFGEIASRNSAEPQARMSQGSVGWLTPQRFGPDFYREVAAGRAGQILGPVKSPAGFHIVKIERRSSEVFRTAVLGYDVEPSRETRDSLRRVAGQLMSLMSQGLNLEAAIDSLNIPGAVRVTNPPLNPATRSVPGLGGGDGILQLVSWAMEGESNKPADKVFETDNAFVVAYLNSVSKGEYQPLDAVREQIARAVLNRKKFELIRDRLTALMASSADLQALKTAYGQGAIVSNAEGISYNANALPGVGAEPRVVGALFGLQPNQNSQVIEGQFGAYIARLKAITEPEAPTDEQVENFRRQMTMQQRAQFQQRANNGIREAARIRDFRYRFNL